ncbi:MATE family efflux transporter [Anaerosacchariphilus polymeriproducens]|uniref:Multidrug export protein MepA n=1 Tax=Anaerosacchariphilus polymeriproducens TaxID=1812858 RepID=A0A371AST2_9FIRM|nr:MATE family efflux transporter [Anaerosacchariphilus polymeriproducens]RDU22625.1 MATE family efflux transporter [Anaerosacchariphilus polymeriproducens]
MTSIFEEKNIPKAIMRVGLPSMLGQLTTLIYNIADTFFVSLTRKPTTIAAVTLCAPILLIIMSLSFIFGMGGSSVIARLLGEEKKKEAGTTMNFCVYALVFAGIITLVLGLVFLHPLAQLVGADADNIGYTCDYLKYIFIGAPFIMLANGFVHLFRSVGLIKESTIGLVLGNIINIGLDYVFIVILGWATAGAALATSLGFLCATIYYIICMIREECKGNQLVPLTPKYFSPNTRMIRNVVNIGIPGALITVLMSVSNIVLNNYIGMYGSDAVASYGIAYKLEMIPILLSVGLSQGVTPLIGYYYGAKKKKRTIDVVKYAMMYGVLLGAIFTAAFLLFGKPLVSIFLHDETLILQTGYFLRILCLSAPMLGVINMVTSYFQALGKAVNSLVITVMRNAVFFIPGVIILNYLWKLNGVIAAQPVVETVLTIICIFMYTKDAKAISKEM